MNNNFKCFKGFYASCEQFIEYIKVHFKVPLLFWQIFISSNPDREHFSVKIYKSWITLEYVVLIYLTWSSTQVIMVLHETKKRHLKTLLQIYFSLSLYVVHATFKMEHGFVGRIYFNFLNLTLNLNEIVIEKET